MPGRRLARASRLPAPQPTRMAQAPRCLAPQRRKHMSSSRRASASRRGHPRRTISVFAPMRATTHCDDRKDSIRSQTRVGSLTSTVTAAVTPRELPQAKRVPLTFVRNGQPSRAPQRTPSLDRHPRRSTGTKTPASRTARRREPVCARVGIGVFMRGSSRKGFLLPYPPATQFETVNRAAQAELPLPQASDPARPASRRLELSLPVARRAAAEPRSVSDEARRLEGRFVLTGYRSWH